METIFIIIGWLGFAFGIFMCFWVLMHHITQWMGTKNPLDKVFDVAGKIIDSADDKLDETPLGEGIKHTFGFTKDLVWYIFFM